MVTLFSPYREGIRNQSLLIWESENDTKPIEKEKEKKMVRLRLVTCKIFAECKIFLGNENIFKCLAAF